MRVDPHNLLYESNERDNTSRRLVHLPFRAATAAAELPGPTRPPSARQPPIGARGFEPQKTTVPSMPMMWTRTMLKTIDLAVAVPTPTGPPEAV